MAVASNTAVADIKTTCDLVVGTRICKLIPVQKCRFERCVNGMTMAEIACSEKATFNSIKETIESAQKKLKKFL